jgi:hypothetical protein
MKDRLVGPVRIYFVHTDLQFFFDHVRDGHGGPISSDVFMSDDAPQIGSAWTAAMGAEATKST